MTEANRVYAEMKEDVVMCVLAPGSSVSEAELCKRYHSSRTPVREACRRLCNEGLVQIVPFRGYTITPLTIEEYRNLYEVQSILDPMIAGLAAERANPSRSRKWNTGQAMNTTRDRKTVTTRFWSGTSISISP